MFKIYLAGAMSGLTKEQRTEWRDYVKQFFSETYKVKIISPCDYYDFDIITPTTTDKEIKQFDLYQVRTSDLILVNLKYPNSIGTAMELQLADDLHIPIIGFYSTNATHPWINEAITRHCATLDEAIRYITKFYIN